MYNRLPEYLNNMTAKEQFGFRKNLTEKATSELSNEMKPLMALIKNY
jgi:hypothetical protein